MVDFASDLLFLKLFSKRSSKKVLDLEPSEIESAKELLSSLLIGDLRICSVNRIVIPWKERVSIQRCSMPWITSFSNAVAMIENKRNTEIETVGIFF